MRYARALLAFAKARGTEDKVYDETKRLARVSVTVPQLRHTIDNPVLSMDAKHKLLCDAVGVENVSEELKRFFRLVLEEKREKYHRRLYHRTGRIPAGCQRAEPVETHPSPVHCEKQKNRLE